MLPLADWDEAYVLSDVVPMAEINEYEAKPSDTFVTSGLGSSETRAEIAKHVSAFSNSGSGFLVFGIKNHRTLDNGILPMVRRQSVTDWIEALIPKLVIPRVTGCQSKLIATTHHAGGNGVLAISIPLSDGRPHWVSESEQAYLRGGAHSHPMRPQTLIDLASRTTVAYAEIEPITASQHPCKKGNHYIFHFGPTVRLLAGPSCERWAFDLFMVNGEGRIDYRHDAADCAHLDNRHLCLLGQQPLFPGRTTSASMQEIQIVFNDRPQKPLQLKAVLYTGSVRSHSVVFGSDELERFGHLFLPSR